MPYISSEQVRSMRVELRKRFPEFKFSVRRDGAISVDVDILSGPIDFGTTNTSVNHYYVEQHWTGVAKDFLLQVVEIVTRGKSVESYDGDYGNIPSWYVSVEVGGKSPYLFKK